MSRAEPLPVDFYRRPAEEVARDLLGRWIVRRLSEDDVDDAAEDDDAGAGEAAEWPLRFAVRGNGHVSKPPVERG